MEAREQEDREFLQFFALVINRILLKIREYVGLPEGEASTPAGYRRRRRLAEAALEDVRRLYGGYRAWRAKSREVLDLCTAGRALLADLSSVFLGPSSRGLSP